MFSFSGRSLFLMKRCLSMLPLSCEWVTFGFSERSLSSDYGGMLHFIEALSSTWSRCIFCGKSLPFSWCVSFSCWKLALLRCCLYHVHFVPGLPFSTRCIYQFICLRAAFLNMLPLSCSFLRQGCLSRGAAFIMFIFVSGLPFSRCCLYRVHLVSRCLSHDNSC